MTARDRAESNPPTADRLRHDIIRGKAGDKVDHSDLAAAPLGTDDEAAGKPASPEELRIAAANTHTKPPNDKTAAGAASFYVAILIAIVVVVLAAAFIFR